MTDWLAAADRVAAVAAEHAVHGERLRRLPMPVVDAMRAEGVQRLCVPAAYGGPEVDPPTILQVIERIATADGAAGWCTMIATTTSLLSHYVEPDHARQIWGDPANFTGGVFARNATATKVDGGYRVSGAWMWGSGTQHCQWITGGATGDGFSGSMWFSPIRWCSTTRGTPPACVARAAPTSTWTTCSCRRVWPLSRRSPVRRSIRHLARSPT